jgi:hypothetical protein
VERRALGYKGKLGRGRFPTFAVISVPLSAKRCRDRTAVNILFHATPPRSVNPSAKPVNSSRDMAAQPFLIFNEPAVLRAWLETRKPDADDFVFNSQKATRLSRITVYKLFRAIARAAGLPETLQHPHVLKHTAAMLMVRAGANAFLIRQHLGHRSFDSTLAYVNPSDGDASAAATKAFSVGFSRRDVGRKNLVLVEKRLTLSIVTVPEFLKI